jgi:hypothetical protein
MHDSFDLHRTWRTQGLVVYINQYFWKVFIAEAPRAKVPSPQMPADTASGTPSRPTTLSL